MIFPSMAVFFFLRFLLFLSSFPHKTLSFQSCPTNYYDGNGSLPPVTVQFPFVAEAANQSHRCGYPGFNLTSDDRTPIISLPFSGNFTVLQIDYLAQIISISDPDSCLPNRILTLNLTNSPFSGADSQNYTFLNCTEANSHSLARVRVRDAVAVMCLSGENFTVYVTSSESAVEKLLSESRRCRLIKSVLAPIMSMRSDDPTRSDIGTAFMQLSWDIPECHRCVYLYGGHCGFKSKSGRQVGCSRDAMSVREAVEEFFEIVIGLMVFGCLIMVIKTCAECMRT